MKTDLVELFKTVSACSRARHVALFLLGLLAVACLSVFVAFLVGQSTSGGSNPVATAISVVALLFSAYTLVRQRYASETASWNTALMRLGQLYDQASQNDDLARLILEPIDRDGFTLPSAVHLSPKQDVWLANLFMAFEQIYVAVSGASRESQGAWMRFLANQINKPTIRMVFLKDAEHFGDYHRGFVGFVCGRVLTADGRRRYAGGAIKREVIQAALETNRVIGGIGLAAKHLTAHVVATEDLPFWKGMYSDPQVERQMYAIPTGSDEEILRYFAHEGKGAAFTVKLDGTPVGGFTIRKETHTRGTFGVVIHRQFRSQGLGLSFMDLLQEKARRMGILVLRADVYSDNIPSIRLLEKTGFRPFVWFEKNLQ